MYYASAVREQPISIVISTAGEDDESALWMEERDRARGILSGEIIDTRRLPFVAEARHEEVSGEGWLNPALWARCNPSWGVTIQPDEMQASADEAKTSLRKKAMFLRYRLNCPTTSISEWIPLDVWNACNAKPAIPEGATVFGGLDLASVSDFTAFVLVYRQSEPGDGTDEDRYHIVPYFWLPEQTVDDAAKAGDYQYRSWVDAGLIKIIPGPVVSNPFVRAGIRDAVRPYLLKECGYDEWNCRETAETMELEDGIVAVKIPQSMRAISEPTKKLERLLRLGKINHGGNPVLDWMFRNTRIRSDDNGNIRPVKELGNRGRKIDGIVASIMGLSRAILHPADSYCQLIVG